MGTTFRNSRRGNAGLAIVAVALLVLAGAAAVVARNLGSGFLQTEPEWETLTLVREARSEGDALSGLARRALETVLAEGFAASPGSLGAMSEALAVALGSALGEEYPRLASSGRTVRATLVFARVEPSEGEAFVPSPFGARFAHTIPLYLEAVGAAQVTVEEGAAQASATVPFAARHPVPLLLPLWLASRAALESGAGGRVERLTAQAVQRALESSPGRPLGGAESGQFVRFALESELALDLGSSGNATLDSALGKLQVWPGFFRASTFFGGWAEGPEPLSLEGLSPAFAVEGELARLRGVRLDTSNVSLDARWTFVDGQELTDTPWGGLALAVSGSFSVEAEVECARGRLAVGPIEVPVSFVARAFTPRAHSEYVVGQAALDGGLLDLSTLGQASRFAAPLIAAGFLPNQTGRFALNASTRSVVLGVLVQEAAARLPPLENITEFLNAWAPPVVRLAPAELILEGPVDLNGSRALVSVDSVPAAGGLVEGGRLAVQALPEGRHAIRVTLERNGTPYAGQTEAAIAGPLSRVQVSMAPSLSSAFLRDALSRGEAAAERAGFAVLDEAGDIVGLRRPSDIPTVLEAAAFAEAVLLRLEALDWAHAGGRAQQARARDAQLFLKVTALTLKAADASYKEINNQTLPIGALASSATELAFRGDLKAVVAITTASLTLAKVAVDRGLVEVTFLTPTRTVGKLAFGFEHLLLVSTALGGALTLATDAVKITRALNATQAADGKTLGLLAASAATDFVGISVGIARGLYTLAGKEALAGVKSPLGRLTLAVGAAALIIDLAALYHKHGGDLGAVWDELVHPGSVGDLLHLPNLVGAAVGITVDLLGMVATTGVAGGPVGLAASLLVLAALLVANKEQVASAIWGTLPYEALAGVRSAAAETLNASFQAAALANSVDRARLEEAARASCQAAATSWLDARLEGDLQSALTAMRVGGAWQLRAAGALRLERTADAMHFAAAALAEQVDDFASPAFVNDEGRRSEGYGFHFEPGKEVHYRGNAEVARVFQGGMKSALWRGEWRALLGSVVPAKLPGFAFAYNLTQTNGIPVSEYQRWGEKVGAAGAGLERAYLELLAAQESLAGP